jgi:hypothetical protein
LVKVMVTGSPQQGRISTVLFRQTRTLVRSAPATSRRTSTLSVGQVSANLRITGAAVRRDRRASLRSAQLFPQFASGRTNSLTPVELVARPEMTDPLAKVLAKTPAQLLPSGAGAAHDEAGTAQCRSAIAPITTVRRMTLGPLTLRRLG